MADREVRLYLLRSSIGGQEEHPGTLYKCLAEAGASFLCSSIGAPPRSLPSFNRRLYPLSWQAPHGEEEVRRWQQEVVDFANSQHSGGGAQEVLPKTIEMLESDRWRKEADDCIAHVRAQVQPPEGFQAWLRSAGVTPPQVALALVARAPYSLVFGEDVLDGTESEDQRRLKVSKAGTDMEGYEQALWEALGFRADSKGNMSEEEWADLVDDRRFNAAFPRWRDQRGGHLEVDNFYDEEDWESFLDGLSEDPLFKHLRHTPFKDMRALEVVQENRSFFDPAVFQQASVAALAGDSRGSLRETVFKPLKHLFVAYCNTKSHYPPAHFYGGVLPPASTPHDCSGDVSIIIFVGLYPNFVDLHQSKFIRLYGYSNDWMTCSNRWQMRPHELVAFIADGNARRVQQAMEAMACLRIGSDSAGAEGEARWNATTLQYLAENEAYHLLFKIFSSTLSAEQRQELLQGDAEKYGSTWNLPEACRNFQPGDGAERPWFQTDCIVAQWLDQ